MSNAVFVDTSAVIAVLAEESPRAAILDATHNRHVLASTSLPFEICNALTASMKKKSIGIDQAIQALALYEAMTIELIDGSIPDALRLAAQHNLYGYDALVLVTARAAGAPLIALDRRMKDVAKSIGVTLVEV